MKDRILREEETKMRTGRSRVQRWRDVKAGKFPAPIQLGPRAIGWRESDIDAWLNSRPAVEYANSGKRDGNS